MSVIIYIGVVGGCLYLLACAYGLLCRVFGVVRRKRRGKKEKEGGDGDENT